MTPRSILKDPLTHFLAAGALVFAAASALAPPEPDEARIEVTRAALLAFIQYRSKAFEPAAAAALLDAMSPAEKRRLVEDFIEEEVLHREAKALGLEENDYVIRQRLTQKLRFIVEAAAEAGPPSEEEIRAFFEAERARYRVQPSATFAHVFFSAERADPAGDAAALIERLNREGAPFEAATRHGDRFPFHTNYVERTWDYVASQFGEEAAREIFAEDRPFGVWRGPVLSPHGAHAIYVKTVEPARDPALEEIREKVAEDAARARREAAQRRVIAETVAQYDIVVAEDVGVAAPEPAAP
ncbi:peptidylprolyl isomerase [Amphiplicatus metriothermophilus]|uniref:peptidylprolyl isomerase n=1 Tax=Amphiplicatus metriothermophilus TaxID=1519374 RepID=A0A239PXX5_9PROT|nr:peptidylprolyl isomerase [Amphiplicatus metriothermophilus]MBB5519909.1 hypothetical protein [Amphiplicatus metriothermophilus]SNT74812.1 PPIC-type PPIASE domain-containing protein [Amphiplicatus metriothermophilus]